jgi:hypothetical protein
MLPQLQSATPRDTVRLSGVGVGIEGHSPSSSHSDYASRPFPAPPTDDEMTRGVRAALGASARVQSLAQSKGIQSLHPPSLSSSSSPPPTSTAPASATDLGPEFLAVLARDFARAGDFNALKAMGALPIRGGIASPSMRGAGSSQSSRARAFAAVAESSWFVPPPPPPAAPVPSRQGMSPTPQFGPAAQSPRRTVRHPQPLPSSWNGISRAEDRASFSSPSPAPFSADLPSLSSSSGWAPPTRRTPGASVARPLDDPSGLSPLERVQVQMGLLSAQADALMARADAMEDEMTRERAAVDLRGATDILQTRTSALAALRGRADALLLETTKEIAYA